jgi:hypothetical protein
VFELGVELPGQVPLGHTEAAREGEYQDCHHHQHDLSGQTLSHVTPDGQLQGSSRPGYRSVTTVKLREKTSGREQNAQNPQNAQTFGFMS